MVLFSGTFTLPVNAQDNSDTVRTWVQQQLDTGFSLDTIGPCRLTLWTGLSIAGDRATRQRIEDLLFRVAGHPEHPGRAELEAIRDSLGDDARMNLGELIIEDSERVRQSNSYTSTDDGFHDMVVTPQLAWSLSPREVSLIDPRAGYPGGMQFGGLSRSVWYVCGFFFHGGLHLVAELNPSIRSVTPRDGHWHCVLSAQDDALRIELLLDWSRENNAGHVLRGAIFDQATGEAQGAWRLDGGGLDSRTGLWVAERWTESRPDEIAPTTWVLDRFEPMTMPDVRAMLRPPDVDRPDPLRGTPPLLVDYRRDDRGLVRALVPGVEVPEGRIPMRPAYARLRWIMFMSAGAVLIALWLIRRKAASPTH